MDDKLADAIRSVQTNISGIVSAYAAREILDALTTAQDRIAELEAERNSNAEQWSALLKSVPDKYVEQDWFHSNWACDPGNTAAKLVATLEAGRHADRVAGVRKAIDTAIDAQPSTAENPNEDSYQRGRFDGIMEFARAILAIDADSAAREISND